MEKLTSFRFEGSDRVQAWCEGCKQWLSEASVCLDCNTPTGLKDYIFCQDCKTALASGD